MPRPERISFWGETQAGSHRPTLWDEPTWNPASMVLQDFFTVEAMIGFEPMKDGFADRCLRPLGHIAKK